MKDSENKKTNSSEKEGMRARDLESDQEIRWCPGCGDFSILKQVQRVLADMGVTKEDTIFISGIGCASRFPYYMETYGLHGIHGRAPAISTGLRAVQPDRDIWVVTGDGDGLSIGGNHLIHLLRRNVNLNLLLFNNEIYGLTKGQYSPTSPAGKKTVSTPVGSVDHPFNPLALCAGADGTFIARTMDREPRHLRKVLEEAHGHEGTSMIEIYQNCNVFNDGAFFQFSDKKVRNNYTLFLEEGEPLIFGKDEEKGIVLDGSTPRVVDLNEEGYTRDDLWVHEPADPFKAALLTRFFDDPEHIGSLPRPFGVIHKKERVPYEQQLDEQIRQAREEKGEGDLDSLIRGDHTWTVNASGEVV